MTTEIRSWRSLKDASIASSGSSTRLKLTWLVESIVRVAGGPVFGGGDSGAVEKRQLSEQVEYVPWSKELYEAWHAAEGSLLTQEQVSAILKAGG